MNGTPRNISARLIRTFFGREARRRAAVTIGLCATMVASLISTPYVAEAASTSSDITGWEKISAAWGGTLQGSNSNYGQGEIVPVRVVVSNETAGNNKTL